MRFIIFFIPLFLFFSCATEITEDVPEHLENMKNLTVYPENPAPAGGIELIREVSFGETDEVLFGRILENIAVDDKGRVFIADMAENKIHIFDSNGSYLEGIGQEGQGPGEFQMIWNLEIHDEEIHVLDYHHLKISVFDLNTFEHSGITISRYRAIYVINHHGSKWTREKGLFYRPTNLFVRADNAYS